MVYVKYVMMLLGVVAIVLGLSAHITAAGGQGIFVLVLCVVPVALGGLSIAQKRGMPRWASIVSAVAFLVIAMKTTEAPFDNIMMAAAGGLLLAIVLAIKPDRSTKAAQG